MSYYVATIIFAISNSVAAKYHGRATVGAYLAKENFDTANLNSPTQTTYQHNDFSILSSRFLLDASDFTALKLKFNTDLRYKQDDYDEVDKRRMELTRTQEFQVKSLYAGIPNDNNNFYGRVGRFSVPEAGQVYVDGLEVGMPKLLGTSELGAFAGLNPKTTYEKKISTNTDAQTAGVYNIYQTRPESWNDYLYLSNSLTESLAQNQSDRLTFFNNTVKQFGPDHRFTNFLFFDFTPQVKLQNMWTSYLHNWTRSWSSTISINHIDPVEYNLVQGQRAVLNASTYNKAALEVKYKRQSGDYVAMKSSYGKRQLDHKDRSEIEAQWFLATLGNQYTNFSSSAGYRQNFESHDVFGKLGLGYFRSFFETGLTGELSKETYTSGKTLNPWVLESTLSGIFSNQLYSTLVTQYTKDEEVEIFALLFRLTYRFGNREIAPLRDGAPARGEL